MKDLDRSERLDKVLYVSAMHGVVYVQCSRKMAVEYGAYNVFLIAKCGLVLQIRAK